MLLQDKQIAIIGGGPGGLTLARLLSQQGLDVKVYERDKDRNVRQQGSTLDLHEGTGLKALEAAGLLEAFKKHYRPGADKMKIINNQMEVVLDDHAVEAQEDFGHEHFRPEIDRGPLRDLLISSLEEENLVWNSRFTEMKPSGTGWELSFENGSTAYADFVIASDGANSKVRKYLTDTKAIYSGVTAIEVNIYNAEKNAPAFWQLASGGKLFALANGKSILFSPKADGTLSFLIGLDVAEDWLANSNIDFNDKSQVVSWFQQEFADWSKEWQSLFTTDEIWIMPRPMYHYPTDQNWETLPNLTMIGDAAHRIPPYAGEGANQALADAVELYEALCLEQFDTIQQAIASFEEKMRTRMVAITEETLQNTAVMHSPENLKFLLDFFAGAANG